jgi:hypothetical protein
MRTAIAIDGDQGSEDRTFSVLTDGEIRVFVNGNEIEIPESPATDPEQDEDQEPLLVTIPASELHTGSNTIAIEVIGPEDDGTAPSLDVAEPVAEDATP